MKILNVDIKNFKKYEEKFFEMDGDFEIVGINGTGKTSLGEAINWCMTGYSLTGNSRYATSFKNNNAKKRDEMAVEMAIMHEGEEYIVRRETSPITAYVNGYETHSITSEILHISEEAFLLLFNPRYFCSLSPKQAKKVLKKELPRVDVKKVYDDNYTKEEKEILDGHTRINQKIKNARTDKKELEKNIDFVEGKLSNFEVEELPDLKSFRDEDTIKGYELMLDEIEFVNDVDTYKKEIHDVKKEIEKIDNRNYEQVSGKKEAELLKKYQNKKIRASELKTDIRVNESELRNQKEIVDKINKNLTNKNTECPECGHEFNRLENEQKNDLEHHKNKISEIKKCKERLEKKLEKIKKQMKKAEEAYDKERQNNNQLRESINEIVAEDKQDRKELNRKLTQLVYKEKEEIKEINKENEEKRKEIQNELEKLKEERRNVKHHNTEVERRRKKNKKIKKEIETCEKDIENSKMQIKNIKNKIKLLKDFNGKIVQKQTKELNKQLDNVEVKLTKVDRSTGEIKNCFEIKYYNGDNWIPYELASFGESQKIGIEIGNMIARQKNINLPLFIDDAQSLTIDFETDRQVIEANTIEIPF
ncbi:MAG: hypothetical protein ACQEQF_00755 [Bacillota bacterium]